MTTSTRIEVLKGREASLLREIEELQRSIAAVTLEGTKAGEARAAQMLAELRQKEDLLAAVRLGLGRNAGFVREQAARERHGRAHKAMDQLASTLRQRQALAEKVDEAAQSLADALRAFRQNCEASRKLAADACSAAFAEAPTHLGRDRAPMVIGAVSVTEDATLVACATMVAQVFDLATAEGIELHRHTTTAMGNGAGHHTNDRCSTFREAADRAIDRLPSVLVNVRSALAAENLPEAAQPEGLLA